VELWGRSEECPKREACGSRTIMEYHGIIQIIIFPKCPEMLTSESTGKCCGVEPSQ
jgi:hypothetical protein